MSSQLLALCLLLVLFNGCATSVGVLVAVTETGEKTYHPDRAAGVRSGMSIVVQMHDGSHETGRFRGLTQLDAPVDQQGSEAVVHAVVLDTPNGRRIIPLSEIQRLQRPARPGMIFAAIGGGLVVDILLLAILFYSGGGLGLSFG